MAKGSGSGCCCNGCEELPYTAPLAFLPPMNPGVPVDPISFAGSPVDLVQAFCCSCLPRAACVTLTCGDQTNSESFVIRCNQNLGGVVNGFARLYSGEMDLAGETHDLEFALEVIDGACYFSLTSYSLGIHSDRKLIDANARSAPQYFCKTLTVDARNVGQSYVIYPTEWTGEAACGVVTVNIHAEDLTAVTRRQPCLDANGNPVPDNDAIRNACQGCGCVCTEACIAVQYPRYNMVEHGRVAIYNGAWTLPTTWGDISIRLVADPESTTRECALKLEASGGSLSFDVPPDLVSINGMCPHPSGTWHATDQDGEPINVTFACAGCGEGCTVSGAGCCYGYRMPRVLHVTISRLDDPPPVDSCRCLPITIPMIFTGDANEPAWTGIYLVGTGSEWCAVSGSRDFTLRLYCGGNAWYLDFGSNHNFGATPCKDIISTPELACEPLNMVFTYVSQCCGMSSTGIKFTITE